MHESTAKNSRFHIDLNADLGEGSSNEEAILALVSSANIACGGHTGDEHSMRIALGLSKHYGVTAGAHPSFPDRDNFGRKPMQISAKALFESLSQQIQNLAAIADEVGIKLNHVKPHGALYNQAAYDPEYAKIMIELILGTGNIYHLFALAGSPLARGARAAGISVIEEAFADRRYRHDASLVPRDRPDAVIESIAEAVQQSLDLIQTHRIQSVDQVELCMHAQTLCVHGDGAHALALIQQLRNSMMQQQIQVLSYLTPPPTTTPIFTPAT